MAKVEAKDRRIRDRSGTAREPIRVSALAQEEPQAGRSSHPAFGDVQPSCSNSSPSSRAGRLRIIDLTQPLGPDTPVIGLPPMFAPSPGVTIDVISKYDDKGPAWYWNTLHLGEHTGTHFDAPIHWITGKDLPNNACDTIEPRRFVGPACVIDVTA